jgi:hypothetical protein
MMKRKIRKVRDLRTVHFGLQTQNEQGWRLLASGVFTTTTLIDISQLSVGFYAISWSNGGKIQASKYFVKTKI